MINNIPVLTITFINTLYYPYRVGGAEISIQVLAEALVERGHNVSVITLTDKKQKSEFLHNGVEVHQIPIKNVYWPFDEKKKRFVNKVIWHFLDQYNIFYARSVEHLLSCINPDVVHTNNLSGFSISMWDIVHRKKIPILHSSRDYYLLSIDAINVNIKQTNARHQITKLLRDFKKIKSRSVRHYIAISHAVKNIHKEAGFFDNAIEEVVYNPIMKLSSPVLKTKRETIVIGYLGRLIQTKGIEVLLEAFSHLDSDIELLIAGTGDPDYVDFLKKKYKSHKIKYLGYIKPVALFSEIDLLVVPSIWQEPFGRVILDAYAYKKPVIVSNCGGMVEIVEPGKTGYIFESQNVIQLKTILENLDKHELRSMEYHVQEYAKRFELENIVEKMESIYYQYFQAYDGDLYQ